MEITSYRYAIIVAAFNEADNIATCLQRIFAVFPNDAEVIVVDGGSDDTGRIVAETQPHFPQLRYIHNENDRGKGHAIRVGMHASRAPVTGQLDADLQFFPEDLRRLFQVIENNTADVALGSRFHPEVRHLLKDDGIFRHMGNIVVSRVASALFAHQMTDVLAGIKAWNTEKMNALGIRYDSFSYEVEIPVRALKSRLRVMDVPVRTVPRPGGTSKVRVIRDGTRILLDTALMKLHN
ncbi:MAG: glycosyltransferase family 2 protein [Deltaproteobacteria bacterium]|nr:glycosyltransferase family 2 protein [Deltaproteobacteria bacterium]MBN2671180.1 glycosyltransferase family 2 protein [Deltaproteobacteria bacterium]